MTQPETRRDRTAWTDFAPHVTAAYFVGVALMLLRLALALQGGSRLRRAALGVDDPGILASLARVSKQIGLAVAL